MTFEDIQKIVENSKQLPDSPAGWEVFYNKEKDICIKTRGQEAIVYSDRKEGYSVSSTVLPVAFSKTNHYFGER